MSDEEKEKSSEKEKSPEKQEDSALKKFLKNPKVIVAALFGAFILVLTITNLDETEQFQFLFWKMNVRQVAYIYTPAALFVGFLGGYLYCKHRAGK